MKVTAEPLPGWLARLMAPPRPCTISFGVEPQTGAVGVLVGAALEGMGQKDGRNTTAVVGHCNGDDAVFICGGNRYPPALGVPARVSEQIEQPLGEFIGVPYTSGRPGESSSEEGGAAARQNGLIQPARSGGGPLQGKRAAGGPQRRARGETAGFLDQDRQAPGLSRDNVQIGGGLPGQAFAAAPARPARHSPS